MILHQDPPEQYSLATFYLGNSPAASGQDILWQLFCQTNLRADLLHSGRNYVIRICQTILHGVHLGTEKYEQKKGSRRNATRTQSNVRITSVNRLQLLFDNVLTKILLLVQRLLRCNTRHNIQGLFRVRNLSHKCLPQ